MYRICFPKLVGGEVERESFYCRVNEGGKKGEEKSKARSAEAPIPSKSGMHL